VSVPDDQVIVHKCDAAGREVWAWQAVLRRATPTSIQVEARFNGPEVDRHGLTFRRGDRFLETYYDDRWYNVFAVFDVATDRLKGWYCNVTRPAHLERGHVRFEDLALDLLVLPDGTTHVLDEEQFDALSLDEGQREAARRALEELKRLAAARSGPFATS
jgi:predicted RNA-binding protein associated with RNAse of E/G family